MRTEDQDFSDYYMNAPIDPDTGLPKLPENYFFRVRKDGGTGYIMVEIRQKVARKFLWRSYTADVRTGYWGCFPEGSSLGKERLLSSAKYAYLKFMTEDNRKDRVKALLGDYPPKSIA